MSSLKEFFSKDYTKMLISFFIIILILYLGRSILDLALMTFLITYLMNSLQNIIIEKLNITSIVKEKFIIGILYTLLFALISFLIVKYVPLLIAQSGNIVNQVMNYNYNSTTNSSFILKYINKTIQGIDLQNYIKSGFNFTFQAVTYIGEMGINIFIALMLSLFFMLEKKRVLLFLDGFNKSKVSILYKYMSFFGSNFVNSFGKVIQIQFVIAIINTLISVIALSVFHFPQLVALGSLIFLLSLIPIAGVIISLFPLCVIAFQIGGLTKVVYVIIMVLIVHIIGSYILYPKLMSTKVKLPVFLTFVILIVSYHFMGIWGLLIGIPLFMFILDLLDVNKQMPEVKNKAMDSSCDKNVTDM